MQISRGASGDPDPSFSAPASTEVLDRAAAAAAERGFSVLRAADAAGARELVLELVPPGSEVGAGASETLSALGVTEALEGSGGYDALRPKLRAMDRATQAREMRKMGAAPDFWLNSAIALTEGGQLLFASATGSQLAPIAYGAGKVVIVVGAQKVVPNLDAAIARLERYSFRTEDIKMRELYGRGSSINKILILSGEGQPGRITIVIVGQAVGR